MPNVLQDLVDSGDLDTAIAARMPTLSFGAELEWTREKGLMKSISATPNAADCSSYRCLLHPDSPGCM